MKDNSISAANARAALLNVLQYLDVLNWRRVANYYYDSEGISGDYYIATTAAGEYSVSAEDSGSDFIPKCDDNPLASANLFTDEHGMITSVDVAKGACEHDYTKRQLLHQLSIICLRL